MRIPSSALRQRMTIERLAGEGAYGPTFHPARTVRCNAQQTASTITEWKGEQIVVNWMIIIRPEDGPVEAGSKVTIDGNTFRIVKAFPMPDAFRPTHWELMAYSWGIE